MPDLIGGFGSAAITYPAPNTYTSFEITITPETDGSPDGYFFAHQFSFTGSTEGGYIGFQTSGGHNSPHVDKKIAILSIWDALEATGSEFAGTFGGEGEGYSARITYAWIVGRSYRVRVVYTGTAETGEWWTGYVTDLVTGIQSEIGSIRVEPTRGRLKSTLVFHERYTGATGDPNAVIPSAVRFTNASANNGAIGASGFTPHDYTDQPLLAGRFSTRSVVGGVRSLINIVPASGNALGDLLPPLAVIEGNDPLRTKSRPDLNTSFEAIRTAVNDLEERKLEPGDVPELVRSSWDALNMDRDLTPSYDPSIGWSGAFDEGMTVLSAGGKLSLGNRNYELIRPVKYLKRGQHIDGTGSEYWPYPLGGVLTGCKLSPMPGFAGEALVLLRDATENGGVEPINCSLSNVGLDGNSYKQGGTTKVAGLVLRGLVRAFRAREVTIVQTSDDGLRTQSVNGQFPRGGKLQGIQVWSAGNSADTTGWGLNLDNFTDTKIFDVLVVDCRGGGIRLNSPGQSILALIHSVFNKNGPGMLVSGGTGNGGLTISDYHTDRNDQDGLCITATGKQHITLNSAELRRDGALGAGWAGLAMRGASNALVAPLQALGLTISVSDSDSPHDAVFTPLIGAYMNWCRPGTVIQGRSIWGLNSSLVVEPNSIDNVKIIDEGTNFYTGNDDTQTPGFPDIKRGKEIITTLPLGPGTWVVPAGGPADSTAGNIAHRYQGVDGGRSGYYLPHDLRRANYIKMVAGITSAGSTGTVLRLQYTLDLTGNSGWTYFDGGSSLNVAATGLRNNYGWAVVPGEAKTDVLVRVLGANGNGSTVTAFASMTMHTRV